MRARVTERVRLEPGFEARPHLVCGCLRDTRGLACTSGTRRITFVGQ